MSPFLRAFLGLLYVLICFGLAPPAALRAQSFSLAATTAQLLVASDAVDSSEVSIFSDDPAFRGYTLSVSNDSGGWLYTSLAHDGSSVFLSSGSSDTTETVATVTVRSPTHEAKLKVRRLSVGPSIKPKVLLSSDKSTLYALYWNTLVAYDASTGMVKNLSRFSMAPDSAYVGSQGRVLRNSADGTALEVFFSAVPRIARFQAGTLAARPALELKDGAPAGTQRIFAGERDGRIYFLRYGAPIDSADTYIYTYFETFVEVLNATDGRLLQSFPVPAPAETRENHFSVDDLALHPRRQELWARTQYETTGYADRSRLLRLRLDENGLVESVVDDGVALESVYYATRHRPWSDDMPRIRFTTRPDYVVTNTTILSDIRVEDPDAVPQVVKTLDSPVTGLTGTGAVAVCSNLFVLLEEGLRRELPALQTRFPNYYNYSVLGFSGDDQELILSSGESSYRLPKLSVEPLSPLLASLPSVNHRTPSDGATVAPLNHLAWRPQPGADRYRVYLADSKTDLDAPEPAAELLLGEFLMAELDLPGALAPGQTYFWRVDSVFGTRTQVGEVQRFGVSHARIDGLPLGFETIVGARRRDVALSVLASDSQVQWSLVSETPWISVRQGSGSGPGKAEISVDALALGTGTHEARLRLTTTEGAVPVTLNIKVRPLDIETMKVLRDAGRLIAIGPSVHDESGTAGRFLLSIDTASEQIALCRPLPVPEFYSTWNKPTLSVTDGANPVYAINANCVAEIDPETLSFKRVFTLPAVAAGYVTPTAHDVRSSEDGRVWISDPYSSFLHYDPRTSRYDLVLNGRAHGERCVLSEDQTTVYALDTDYSSEFPTLSFTLRRLARDGASLTQSAATDFVVSNYHRSAPLRSIRPFRFVANGVVCDESLGQIADLNDPIVAIAADGSAMVGPSLIYQGENYREARILPDYHPARPRHYDAVSRKLVVYEDSLRFVSVDSLPLVSEVAIRPVAVVDTEADFAWERAPNYGGFYSTQIDQAFSYRRAGSDDPWTYAGARDLYSNSFRLLGLSPETTYEVRARAERVGAFSHWSQPVTITTTITRPAYDATAWPPAQSLREGAAVALSIPVSNGKSRTSPGVSSSTGKPKRFPARWNCPDVTPSKSRFPTPAATSNTRSTSESPRRALRETTAVIPACRSSTSIHWSAPGRSPVPASASPATCAPSWGPARSRLRSRAPEPPTIPISARAIFGPRSTGSGFSARSTGIRSPTSASSGFPSTSSIRSRFLKPVLASPMTKHFRTPLPDDTRPSLLAIPKNRPSISLPTARAFFASIFPWMAE